MNISHIHQDDSYYPSNFKKFLIEKTPNKIAAIDNLDSLRNKILAIFSSKKCPGKVIMKTYDLMRQFRNANVTVSSGFHSPMEQECLNILLRGKQPVIICPGRSIKGMRIKSEYKEPLKEGRLLFLSPFNERENRISAERSDKRNHFVAAIADEIIIPYAAPGGKTEALCRDWIKKGKTVRTFDSSYNKNLFELGAKVI